MDYMKRNKYIYGVMAAGLLLAASCTDFDDYNKAYTGAEPGSTQTLWDNISQRGNLSQFASLLQKGGYDTELQNSRFYTVWAPEDGTFNYDSVNALGKDALVKKFINSHVANFNYTQSLNQFVERVHTLNEKSFTFAAQGGQLTFDDKQVLQRNIPNLNGVLHTIGGAAQFLPNIYEFALDSVEAKTAGFDSIMWFYKGYETTKLDLEKSIEGPVDDEGNQTYSDSVMVTTNQLTGRGYMNADLACEDSAYTILLPTNEAYTKAYNAISKNFKYVSTINYWTFPEKNDIAPVKAKKDVDLLQQDTTMTRTYIYRNTIFNNNYWRNRWLVNPADPYAAITNDTLYSTRNAFISNGTEVVLNHTVGSAVKMSNGYARIVDSLAFHPWEVWNPVLNVSIGSSTYRARVNAANARMQTINYDALDQSKGLDLYSYLDLIPSSDNSQPEAYFYINGVRSTTYNVYVVMVPANIRLGSKDVAKSYKFQVSMNFADAKGNMPEIAKPSVNFGTFTSDSTKLDTIMVGSVTFPVAYAGVDGAYPFIMLKSQRSTWNKKEWDTIDNRMRIAAIYLVPDEYDKYLKEQEAQNEPEKTEE